MAEIDVVRAMLAQMRNPDAPPQSLSERRTAMDAFGDAAQLPEHWRIEDDALGRPAQRHAGPDIVQDAAILYLHGGGYVLGSPASHRGLVAQLARAAGTLAFALDYRLAPEHRCPAAIDDAFAAYEQLLDRGFAPQRIAIAGDSAGGGLALATALRIREQGRPAPAALVLISPWLDLTQSGESYATRAALDPVLTKQALEDFAADYVGPDGDRRGIGASPLFADLKGLPKTLTQVGDAEILLSDAERFHERALAAGVSSELETAADMTHVWHIFYPILEPARAAIERAGRFVRAALN